MRKSTARCFGTITVHVVVLVVVVVLLLPQLVRASRVRTNVDLVKQVTACQRRTRRCSVGGANGAAGLALLLHHHRFRIVHEARPTTTRTRPVQMAVVLVLLLLLVLALHLLLKTQLVHLDVHLPLLHLHPALHSLHEALMRPRWWMLYVLRGATTKPTMQTSSG